MLILKISKEQLKTLGSHSLIGRIANECKDQEEFPKEIELQFEQSPFTWQKLNDGADIIQIPEFVIPALCESIKNLTNRGIHVSFGEYEAIPKK